MPSEPIIPGVIRAQAVIGNISGVPRDFFVNTFHFLPMETSVTDADKTSVAAMIADFYNHTQTAGYAIASFLGAQVDRGTDKCKVNVYDLGNSLPRPVVTTTFTMGAATSGSALPEEVASCLSFYAARNIPRHRGRIYLGPLNTATITGTGGIPAHTLQAFRDTAVQAAQRLIAGTAAVAGVTPLWAVLSKKDLTARVIDHGWMDDTFDTQRRRGPRPSLRTSW